MRPGAYKSTSHDKTSKIYMQKQARQVRVAQKNVTQDNPQMAPYMEQRARGYQSKGSVMHSYAERGSIQNMRAGDRHFGTPKIKWTDIVPISGQENYGDYSNLRV